MWPARRHRRPTAPWPRPEAQNERDGRPGEPFYAASDRTRNHARAGTITPARGARCGRPIIRSSLIVARWSRTIILCPHGVNADGVGQLGLGHGPKLALT